MISNNIKLLIADDHELVRIGLRDFFEFHSSIDVLEEADNGEDAVELAEYYRPDMVLMDYKMPRLNGDEACRLIKRNNPDIKVVLYLADDGTEKLYSGNDCISDGMLSKQLNGNDLVNALCKIANGERVCSFICEDCHQINLIKENVALIKA